MASVYGSCDVVIDGARTALPAYARFDAARATAMAAEVALVIDDVAVAASAGSLQLASGARVACGVVVDCTGESSALSGPRDRARTARVARQTACGLLVRGSDPAIAPGAPLPVPEEEKAHELQDSIEQPGRLRAQSGRLAANASRSGCSS